MNESARELYPKDHGHHDSYFPHFLKMGHEKVSPVNKKCVTPVF